MNIFAQIFGILALIIMFLGYQKKSKKEFLSMQIFMNICFGFQYFLLNAFSALASNIISIIKSTIFYKYEKEEKNIPLLFLIIFEIIIIISGIFTYNGFYSIIPLFIAILYTYGTWQKELQNTYKIGVFVSILWIYYNFIVGAYVAVIGSIIELIASISGVIKIKNVKANKNKQ